MKYWPLWLRLLSKFLPFLKPPSGGITRTRLADPLPEEDDPIPQFVVRRDTPNDSERPQPGT